MRKYALVIFDREDNVVDRLNLDLVTNPTGNGFKFNLISVATDIEDVVTKIIQVKQPITFIVNQYENPYTKSTVLSNWILKHTAIHSRMALEYDDGNLKRYCDGKVTSLTKTEKDEFGILAQQLAFTPTTPFFILRQNAITIKVASAGKSYPYSYEYTYGVKTSENNDIENVYFDDIPIIVTISGAITNPTIDLLDENGERYSRVFFDGVTIKESEKLIINSAERKIYKINEDGSTTDFVSEVSPLYDTFLRANTGKSKLSINTSGASSTFKLVGGWRQYTL